MESRNDNKNNVFPVNLATTATVTRNAKSLSHLQSLSSDLVTKSQLLTREEECTLKTALAFVVIKARARGRANARAKGPLSETHTSIPISKNSPTKKHRISESYATNNEDNRIENDYGISSLSPSLTAFEDDSTSILDHLFSHRNTGAKKDNNESRLRKFRQPRFLECTLGRDHIDHMFRAAKTLAETWLVTKRNHQMRRRSHWEGSESPTLTMKDVSVSEALVGATGHLARQLQLLLVVNQNNDDKKIKSIVNNKPPQNTQSFGKRKVKEKHTSKVRYRRPSLSSKSVADSISTPSSASRKDATEADVATGTIQSANGDVTNHDNREMEIGFNIQEWISLTLLQQDDSKQHTMITDTANKEPKLPVTLLSCQKTTVLDVLASFHVYSVMVPQISRISPPLIGHVFQVVAKVVRDLFNDRITAVGKDVDVRGEEYDEGNLSPTLSHDNSRQLLDHLATSALALLELCWTTKICGNSEESHRTFLLLSLQEILGDLLVPLPRSELAGEHYRLTLSASRIRTLQHRQRQLVRKRPNQGGSSPSTESENQPQTPPQQQRRFVLRRQINSESEGNPLGQPFRKVRNNSSIPAKNSASDREEIGIEQNPATKNQTSRGSPSSLQPNSFVGGIHLDPEAKLLLRMSVYRLIVMGKKN